jgi:hypothetical protein
MANQSTTSHSQHHTSGLYEGLLEPDSGCTDVIAELVRAIQSESGFLPQKYLYASLSGGRLWQELCTGIPINTHIAEVYKRFPLGISGDKLTAEFCEQTSKLSFDPSERQMGVIALGAGTGTREAVISRWLVNELGLSGIEAYLVDVSSELLGESLKEFHRCGDRIHPKFAVLDFESSRGHAQLVHLREILGDIPTVFLLLGNTFGNIDQDTFVNQIADVMRPKDMLLCEFLLATNEETQPSSPDFQGVNTVQDRSFDASKDPRAQFMLNPLRSLGFNPKFKNLQRWIARSPGKWRRDEYRYAFDADERQLAPSLSRLPGFRIGTTSWIGLLKIQAVTESCCESLFNDAFASVRLVPHAYDLSSASGRPVLMGYCFATKPKEQTASETPHSEQATAPTQKLSVHPTAENQFCKRGEKWEVRYRGKGPAYLDDGLGPQYLAMLLMNPGKEFHCSVLAATRYRSIVRSQITEGNTPTFDPIAKRQIQKAMEELAGQIEAAKSNAAPDQLAEMNEQLTSLAEAMSAATAVAGKNRGLGDNKDRLRNAVCNRIRPVLTKLRDERGFKDVVPDLGKHLFNQVKLGHSCKYPKESGSEVTWKVETCS